MWKKKQRRWSEKVTRIIYHVKSETSVAELFYSYKQSLNQAGFREIFSCKNEKCGNRHKYKEVDRYMGYSPDFRYLAAASADDQIRVAILAQGMSRENRLVLNIVERGELNNLVAVSSAEELVRAIEDQGHVVLDGIFFDHDQAELKSESEEAIKKVASILKQDPNLRLHVVGHTDSNGDFSHNLRLSKSRADAVVKHLIDAYGIVPDRLNAHGVASLALVAANTTDEGRARNRRVELVKQ